MRRGEVSQGAVWFGEVWHGQYVEVFVKLMAIAFLAASAAALGQSAKVIKLAPSDVETAKQIDEDQRTLDVRRGKFHDHIVRQYLVTTKTKDAEGCCGNIWSDPEDRAAAGMLTYWGMNSSGLSLSITNQGFLQYNEHCATPEEKARHKVEDEKVEKERQEFQRLHPTKYYRKGWNDRFEYSEGFEYIVPEKETKFYPAETSCGLNTPITAAPVADSN